MGQRGELESGAAALAGAGVQHSEVTDLPIFGIPVLSVADPDGIQLEITAPLG